MKSGCVFVRADLSWLALNIRIKSRADLIDIWPSTLVCVIVIAVYST